MPESQKATSHKKAQNEFPNLKIKNGLQEEATEEISQFLQSNQEYFLWSHKLFTNSTKSLKIIWVKIYRTPLGSRYECPCGYHSRQREEQRRRLEAVNCTPNHLKLVEEFHVHGRAAEEGSSTGILLISDGNEHEYNDKDEENELSMKDAYASASGWSQDDAVALEDVDKRAEKFIKEFREQLRIQRALSSEKDCNMHTT